MDEPLPEASRLADRMIGFGVHIAPVVHAQCAEGHPVWPCPEDARIGLSATEPDVAPIWDSADEEVHSAAVLLVIWGEIGAWHQIAEYETTLQLAGDQAELARWRRIGEALQTLISRTASVECRRR